MYSVDIYSRVRRACLKDGMSARAAARYFNKDRKTIAKMLRHELPPGYRRSEAPHRPTLDPYVGVIDEILRTDKALIKKQRHTKQAQICAAENKDHIHYLARLCEMELIDRERRMIERRIKAAKFPSTKSLDSFDFKIMASLNKPLTMELARCDYVDRRENIIALGPSGTGKRTSPWDLDWPHAKEG